MVGYDGLALLTDRGLRFPYLGGLVRSINIPRTAD